MDTKRSYLPRRRPRWTLALGLGLGLVAAATVACGSDGDPDDASPSGSVVASATGDTTPTSASAGEPGGTLVIGMGEDPEQLDPNFARDLWAETVTQAIFDPIIYQRADGTLGPGLASEFEFTDDTTLSLTLRDGVTFHNGEPFNADAVKFSIDRMQDKIFDEASHLIPQFKSIEEVEVVDDTHVVLHLASPDANLLWALTRLMPTPPAYTQEVGGTAGIEAHPIGTGPFKFVSYSADSETVVEANTEYWADSPKGQPLVDRVIYRVIPEITTRVASLTTGDVHIIGGLSIDQHSKIEQAGLTVESYPDGRSKAVWINANQNGVLAEKATGALAEGYAALTDPLVRQALNYAIDREAISASLHGGTTEPLGQVFSPGGFGYNPENEPYPYDPDKALELLAEAGYPDGFTVQLVADNQVPVDDITAIMGYLAEIGVEIEFETIDPAVFNDRIRASEVTGLRYQPWTNTPTLLDQLIDDSNSAYASYGNAEVDRLVDEQRAAVDEAKRAELLKEIIDLMREDPPAIFLWSSVNTEAWNQDTVTGYAPHAKGFILATNLTVSG